MFAANKLKIYNAARHGNAPTLPLREELDIIAIECVYEPQKKKKFLDGHLRDKEQGRFHNDAKFKLREIRRSKSFWEKLRRRRGEDDCESKSTVSSLTMGTFQEEVKQRNEEDLVSTTDNIETGTKTRCNYSIDDNSESDMDDMTICIVALVGNEDDTKNQSDIIFTNVDTDESTKWFYEGQKNISDDQFYENCSICDCFDLKSFADSTQSLFHPSKIDVENYDLKLKIDTNDFIQGQEITDQKKESLPGDKLDQNVLHTKADEVESMSINLDEQRNPVESLAKTPDRKTSRNVDRYQKDKSILTSDLNESISVEGNGTKQKILSLKNTQLVKYQVVQSTLEDDLTDKGEVEDIYKKMMNQISYLGNEINQLSLLEDFMNDFDEDSFNEIDDSIEELDLKIASQKQKLSRLLNEHELDVSSSTLE